MIWPMKITIETQVYRASGPPADVYRASRLPDVYNSIDLCYNSYSGHNTKYALPQENIGFAGHSARGYESNYSIAIAIR